MKICISINVIDAIFMTSNFPFSLKITNFMNFDDFRDFFHFFKIEKKWKNDEKPHFSWFLVIFVNFCDFSIFEKSGKMVKIVKIIKFRGFLKTPKKACFLGVKIFCGTGGSDPSLFCGTGGYSLPFHKNRGRSLNFPCLLWNFRLPQTPYKKLKKWPFFCKKLKNCQKTTFLEARAVLLDAYPFFRVFFTFFQPNVPHALSLTFHKDF